MDETQRKQTTKGTHCGNDGRLMTGIWLSRAVDSDILIMDVEGTDSRERGDEQVYLPKEAGLRDRTLNVARRCFHSLFQK